jgi:hypothetical protein
MVPLHQHEADVEVRSPKNHSSISSPNRNTIIYIVSGTKKKDEEEDTKDNGTYFEYPLLADIAPPGGIRRG